MTATTPSYHPPGAERSATVQPNAAILEPFPEPSRDIQHAFEVLSAYHAHPPQTHDGLQEMAATPRPWDPANTTGRLRLQLWLWLDQVAEWINTQHLWNTTRPGIPECWPAHPHLAHDLAVVASARYLARFATSPGALDEWHRYTLPMFLDRLQDRLAEACQPGKHLTRPRTERDTHYSDAAAANRRREHFNVDAQRTREHG